MPQGPSAYYAISCVNSSYYNASVYTAPGCTGARSNSQVLHIQAPANCSLVRGVWSQYAKGTCVASTLNNVPFPSAGFVGLTTTGSCTGPITSGTMESCESESRGFVPGPGC